MCLEEFEVQTREAIAAYEAAGGDFQALLRSLNAPPPVVLLDETDADGDSEVSFDFP